MLLRVFCPGCRLSPAWTDDPAGLLGTVCGRPFRCDARLCDEQAADVTARYMEDRHRVACAVFAAPSQAAAALAATVDRPPSRVWLAGAIACLAALLVCREMASAYESASLLWTGFALGIPPLVALLLYQSSPKLPIAVLLSTAVAVLGIALIGVNRISANVLAELLLVTGAVTVPVVLDLALTNLGRMLVVDVLDWRVAALTFFVAVPILCTIAFPSTLRAAREADARLIRRLARRTQASDGSLIIDELDPGLARKAQQRLAIRAGGRTYELSEASTRTTLDDRGVTSQVVRHGQARSSRTKRTPDERVALVLDLAGTPLPEAVEFEGLRGPTTIYSETVALAK